MKYLYTAIMFLAFTLGYSQDVMKKYTIEKISVTGSKTYSGKEIKKYSGLNEGMQIMLRGDKIRTAIKRLWESKLFNDVNIYKTKIDGDKISLEIELTQVPVISSIDISGVKKSKKTKIIKDNNLEIGKSASNNFINSVKNKIENNYAKKGYLKANADISVSDSTLKIKIDKNKKIKIGSINFSGNKVFSGGKLRRTMKKTTVAGRALFTGSKYLEENLKTDLELIVDKYKSNGFRDARIVNHSISYEKDDRIKLDIDLYEGTRYFFRNIEWIGNTAYSNDILNKVLGYANGDPYDIVGFSKKMKGDPKNRDIHSLYLDSGYLFSNVNFVESKIEGDSIDVQVMIHEDKQARINKVNLTGNTRTFDHVVFRELRTKPGDLFSKSKLQRSYRELAQLGFFDAEKLKLEPVPNYKDKTVDINYGVVETGSSQIELQGGYGGGSFIGTLGLTFSNFSLRNIFNKDAWKPIPMGDGQKISIKASAARGYQAYSLSFEEPWLGGKRPTSLSVGLNYSIYKTNNSSISNRTNEEGILKILGISVGLGKRLTWPDDYFYLRQSLSFQRYDLKDYYISTFGFSKGASNNINYNLTFGRNSSGPNPIYPTEGSSVSASLKITPPYSLFGMDAKDEKEAFDLAQKNYNSDNKNLAYQKDLLDAKANYLEKQFNWLEFYKLKFKADWYKSLAKNLVLRFNAEAGTLSSFSTYKGVSPFERFYIGGTGSTGGRFDGRELIPLRGYNDSSTTGGRIEDITPLGGGVIYNKFMMELRYPITLKPAASIFLLGFLEAGNTYSNFDAFNPANLKRSAGVGIRIFMPAFGLLGLDFGYGFDNNIGSNKPSGWNTHFIIGQSF